MPDYTQRIYPPDYRNLAVNPSGEDAYAASWTSTNGTVYPGSTATTPRYGSAVAEYTVQDQTLTQFTVTPFGPDDRVHRNAFAVPDQRTVSARVSVSAPSPVWVQLQARYMVWDGSGLANTQTRVLAPAQPTPATGWLDLEGYAPEADVPRGATHWALDIALYMSDPNVEGVELVDPPLGTKLWVDGVFVPDSGVNIAGVPYLDGDQPGAYWEGEEHFSTSRTGEPYVPIVDDSSPAKDDVHDPDAESTTYFEDDAAEVEIIDSDWEQPAEVPRGAEPIPQDAPEETQSPPTTPTTDIVSKQREVSTTFGGGGAGGASSNRLCLNEDIQLSDLRLNTVDANGTVWIVTDVEGWWTLPEVEVPDLPRGWDDGSFESRGRYMARLLTLTGVFIPRSRNGAVVARNTLLQAANLCHRGNYFMTYERENEMDDVDAPPYAKGAKVWLSGSPEITTTSTSGKTEFSIGLRAPDPIKYSILYGIPPGYNVIEFKSRSQRWPGRSYSRKYSKELGLWKYPDAVFGATEGIAHNYGNAPVKPIVEVHGPTNGPIVILNLTTEQQMRVSQRLYPGEVLKINCDTKRVTLNQAPNQRFYLDIDVDWFMVQPGANRFYFLEESNTNPNTKIRVYWRSGWIG